MRFKLQIASCILLGMVAIATGYVAFRPETSGPPADIERTATPSSVVIAVPGTPVPEVARHECAPAGVIGVANESIDGVFLAPFTGSPPQPIGLCGATDWDIQIHSRDDDTWFELEPIDAQHGPECSGPPNTHRHNSYADAVFLCRDHVMTSLNAGGYGVIYLTPNQVFDFSKGGTLTFDLSTERMSKRDWWDVLITPFDENHALPLLSDLSEGVDLQGFPLNAISIATDNGEGSPVLKVVRNGRVESFQAGYAVSPPESAIDPSVNQAATRQTFKLTIDGGRMKFERLASATAPAIVFWEVLTDLPLESGIVQFGHHSYNPTKDNSGVPATWHWDNLGFSQALPFTMIKADRRYTEGGEVNFAAPAPEDAYLRFAAICRVRIDGQLVERQPSARRDGGYQPEHSSSYFVPIAAGTQRIQVTFEPDDWYQGPCIAKDFAIWAR